MSTEPVDTTGDVVVTDKELFDHAISNPEPAPATPASAETSQPQPEPEAQQPAPVRDEQGRFAPKTAQQPSKPEQQQPPQRQPEDHRVPLRELLEVRERAQRAEAEAAQMRQAWAQYQAQQQAAQQAPQTIFDNPDDYLQQRVIAPLRQEMQMEMMKRTDMQSREFANVQFGAQVVDAALRDISQIRQTPQGEFIFNQIMASGHPYGALVNWHKTARAQQAIGPDPNAWLQQKQQEWVKDPKAQAAVLQYLRQQQQTSGRPSNVSLPPSLSTIPASSGRTEEGDMSNDSLYRFATK